MVGVLTAAGGLARIFSPLWSALVLVAASLFHTASVPLHSISVCVYINVAVTLIVQLYTYIYVSRL